MSHFMGLKPLMACSALVLFGQIASAQTKVAVVNLQQAVFECAEIRKADSEMQAKYKPKSDEAQKLQNDINDISQRLQAGQGKLSQQAEAELNAEGTRKQRELQRINEDLQSDVERDRNEILTTSSRKMTEIVKKLAQEKGFDMVVDATTTLYFKDAMDITKDAIAAYDKAYPAAVPATAAAAPAAKK
jgi:outer membrane protein